MGQERRQQFFPFMQLPDLVQYLVLIHTDLVPRESVPIPIASRSRVHPGNDDLEEPVWPRKSTAPSNHKRLCACELCAVQPPSEIYASKGCTCEWWDIRTPRIIGSDWVLPTSIFLVSKRVNTLAKSVFFTQNKFIIWDNSRAPSRLLGDTASEFVYLDLTLRKLRQIPLASFRWLEFQLESFRTLENKKDGISYQLWHELAKLIRSSTLPRRLTLVIDFSFMNGDYSAAPDNQEDHWEAYQNIACAFKHGERLFKDFFLHLADPGTSSYEEDLVRWTRERKLEKLVMNDREYDSASRGKYKQRWLDESHGPRMYFRHILSAYGYEHLDDRDPGISESILNDTVAQEYGHYPRPEFRMCPDHF